MTDDLEWLLQKVNELRDGGVDDQEISVQLGISKIRATQENDFLLKQIYGHKLDLMSYLEKKRIPLVANAVRRGAETLREVAEITEIPYQTLYVYSRKGLLEPFKIEKLKRGRPSKNQRGLNYSSAVWEAVAAGAETSEEVAVITGASWPTVVKYREKFSFNFPRRRFSNSPYSQNAIDMYRQGSSLEEIASSLGTSPQAVQRFLHFKGILGKPHKVQYSRTKVGQKKLIRLAKKGLTLETMGSIIGVTRERVRQKISETWIYDKSGKEISLYDKWRECRFFARNEGFREEQKEEIISKIIGGLLVSKYDEASWPQKKAIEFFSKRPTSELDFGAVTKLFWRYEEARKNEEALSYKQLGEGTTFHIVTVGTILRETGLPSFIRNLDRKSTPKEKKDALRRAINVEMSSTDIAYFLDIPSHVASQNMRKYGRRPRGSFSLFSVSHLQEGVHNRLTYSLASQFYEAKDLGFSSKEIANLFDSDYRIVKHALENRREISGAIVHGLRTIFPGRKIRRPYL